MPDHAERQKILIVDDNKQNIDILMDLFKDSYKVVASLTPDRALKIAASDAPPDIILLDIIMPGMDGYEVCALLKHDEKTKDIPIIFITAVSEVMDAAKGFDLGAADYITKPFHPPMVEARVRMQLSLKRKQKMLEELAFIDALTEIPNRRRFEEVAAREWNRFLRSGTPLSIMLIDVDRFKNYNDTYGHGKGDEALRLVAQAMRQTLKRASDFLARYGGEEFAVLLPYTDQEHALNIASLISASVQALNIRHASSSVSDRLSISIGVTTITTGVNITLPDIMEQVDKALYEAKSRGRNRTEANCHGAACVD